MPDTMKKVLCPFCGYRMPLTVLPGAECEGLRMRCKNKKCRREFEVIVKRGIQSR